MRLYRFSEDFGYYYLIFEFVQGETLMSYLKSFGTNGLSESQIASMTEQILLAISACHVNKIEHRDLKYENILVGHNMKLIDFDLARVFENMRYDGSNICPIPQLTEITNPKCDIYSLGSMIYSIINSTTSDLLNENRRMPWFYHETHNNSILIGNKWDNMSVQGKQFVLKMVNGNLDQIPPADELLKDPWLSANRIANKTISSDSTIKLLRNFKLKTVIISFNIFL